MSSFIRNITNKFGNIPITYCHITSKYVITIPKKISYKFRMLMLYISKSGNNQIILWNKV